MASFEGKSVTDQHPPEDVHSTNYQAYEKGHVQNVRRGQMLESGDTPLIANLLIKDSMLAGLVEPPDGVRHVSIGYTHKIVPYGSNGDYQAVDLRGNHVACVPKGRAGPEVSIRDAAPTLIPVPKKPRSTPNMDRTNLFGRMLKAFAGSTDCLPEEVAEAAKFGKDEESEAEQQTTAEERLKSLENAFSEFTAYFAADKKARDEAKEETKKEEPKEEAAKDEDLIEEEKEKAEDDAEEGVVVDPADRPENPIGDSADATLIKLRALKPLVAKSGDKSMIDAFNSALRAAKGGKKSGQDGYKALQQALATKSQDAEAAMVDAHAAELVAYKTMLDLAGEKAAAGYRRQ
jgi:hypothetical protein